MSDEGARTSAADSDPVEARTPPTAPQPASPGRGSSTSPLGAEPLSDQLRSALRDGRPIVLVTVVDGPGRGSKLLVRPDGSAVGSLGHPELDRVVARDVLGDLAQGRTGLRHYGPEGQAVGTSLSVFVESFTPPPRMLVFGAVDFTGALVRVAKVLGFVVTVCDAREVFATRARFPEADEVVVEWPDRFLRDLAEPLGPADAVCVLTHDVKFDVPALVEALASDVGYIGAMGSRRTHAERTGRLREAGVDDAGLARIAAPIGLDIGARTPEETAVAICAEIIAHRTGRAGGRLLGGSGPIH